MSVERRLSSSSETCSLLEETPPSYHSTNDVNNCSPPQPPINAVNKFSRTDTCWILAGLWSGVLLGAFDGTLRAACRTIKSLTTSRNRRCHFINANWERIQGVEPIFLYWYCILAIRMLFHTSLWSVVSIIFVV
jgi:hypothetical protein